MKGVSEVIAIILILMITISLAGLAYMFMSTTMSDVTASASSTVDTTTTSMLTSFTIESVDIAKIYVRNTGQNAITSLSVYVNDEPATFNVTPTSIEADAVGTVTIYSFIPDGAMVKVVSPSGFSASKVAQPCEKATACWKFDEASGLETHDSSPNGNSGKIVNMSVISNQYDPNILIIEEESCGSPSSSLYNALISAGFAHITKNTSITTKSAIDAINPDIIIAADIACAVNNSALVNELYMAGYNVFTRGNDHMSSIRPISSYVFTNLNAPTIIANNTSGHPISQGWETSGGSGTDSRNGITAIHPSAVDIADDTVNNFIEAVYLHEDGKGGWFHIQSSATPTAQLLKNAIYYIGSYPLASPNNATSGWGNGRFGSGLKFDGVNDYVDFGQPEILSLSVPFTLSAWVYHGTLSTGQIITKDWNYKLYMTSSNKVYVMFRDQSASAWRSLASNSALAEGWNFVSTTLEPSGSDTEVKIYINGNLDSSGTLIGKPTSYGVNFRVGMNQMGTENFNGTIDEVRIYSRAIY